MKRGKGSMEHILRITVIGMVAGVAGTALGGVVALFFRTSSKKVLSFVLEFSAGLMTAIVCFDLLPSAFELSSFMQVMAGIVAGILFAMLLQEKIKYSESSKQKGRSGLFGTGVMMLASIAAHNFPEGLAIGSGFEASMALGLSLTIVIIVHDVPEGLALALPLNKGGVSASKTVALAALSGIPTGIGALIGAAIGYISKDVIAVCLAAAGGAMLYVSVGDLIPESKNIYNGRWSAVGNVLGILAGMVIALTFR